MGARNYKALSPKENLLCQGLMVLLVVMGRVSWNSKNPFKTKQLKQETQNQTGAPVWSPANMAGTEILPYRLGYKANAVVLVNRDNFPLNQCRDNSLLVPLRNTTLELEHCPD